MDLVAVGLEAESELDAMLESEDGWKVVKTSEYATLEMKKSSYFDGNVYRALATLDVPYDQGFKYLDTTAGSARYEWDTDSSKHEVLEQLNPDTQLQRLVSNSLALGLISSREFTEILKVKKTDTMMQVSGKTVELDAYPVSEKAVRGCLYPSGLRVTQDSSDARKCHVKGIFQSDLRGKIPKMLLDSTLPSVQLDWFKKCNAHLKKKGLIK